MQSKLPHAQHVNEVLLGDIIFLVHIALQRSEDVSFLHDIVSASTFYVEKGLVGDAVFVSGCATAPWGYSEIFEFFSKYDDGLFAEKRVLRGGRTKVRGGSIQQMLLGGKQAGRVCGSIKCVRRIPKEIQDV